MIIFQWVALTVLGGLVLVDILGWLRGRRSGITWLLRVGLWTAAAVAIYQPLWVTFVAQQVGIQRGADLVTYAVALSFIAASFFFYSRYLELQRQMTELVRRIAIRDAQRGADSSASPPEECE